ncbi:hypothetical protein F2P81_006458 [Scophthalmus maximus]|uniref:Uncharacterized protein n=1 Tax=Scophthalmus maximus TaxID=52904 RepID=A0A6A4T9H0_SCOMX|nr:hypothetical protein F2P81_006458 [Scophthalmus maximus]
MSASSSVLLHKLTTPKPGMFLFFGVIDTVSELFDQTSYIVTQGRVLFCLTGQCHQTHSAYLATNSEPSRAFHTFVLVAYSDSTHTCCDAGDCLIIPRLRANFRGLDAGPILTLLFCAQLNYASERSSAAQVFGGETTQQDSSRCATHSIAQQSNRKDCIPKANMQNYSLHDSNDKLTSTTSTYKKHHNHCTNMYSHFPHTRINSKQQTTDRDLCARTSRIKAHAKCELNLHTHTDSPVNKYMWRLICNGVRMIFHMSDLLHTIHDSRLSDTHETFYCRSEKKEERLMLSSIRHV